MFVLGGFGVCVMWLIWGASLASLIDMEKQSTLAIIAVIALLVGLGGGYFYGTSMMTPEPMMLEPVDGLDRPDVIPLVHGWYRGEDVVYFDFGLNPNVAIPIMVFFQMDNPDMMVDGQMNIIDSVPGVPGYSDFWRVFKVLAPSDYEANSITSLEGVVESGYEVVETDIVVNCPVVNPDTVTEEVSYDLVQGWYRGREVFYFDFGANSDTVGWVVELEPIYAFFYGDSEPVMGQMNVIDALPMDMDYSDLWHVHKVIVGMDYEANSLNTVADIMDAVSNGSVSIEATDLYVNCPVIEG